MAIMTATSFAPTARNTGPSCRTAFGQSLIRIVRSASKHLRITTACNRLLIPACICPSRLLSNIRYWGRLLNRVPPVNWKSGLASVVTPAAVPPASDRRSSFPVLKSAEHHSCDTRHSTLRGRNGHPASLSGDLVQLCKSAWTNHSDLSPQSGDDATHQLRVCLIVVPLPSFVGRLVVLCRCNEATCKVIATG